MGTTAWPFFLLTDERGAHLGWACVSGPVRPDHEPLFQRIAARHRLLGFTSMSTFPDWRDPDDPRDWGALCEAWCHCFRAPEAHLPASRPRTLLAYSDFLDYARAAPERFGGPVARDVDFLYVCQDGPWYARFKNWPLAQRCLPVLCGELGLRGLLIGRETIPDLDGLEPHVVVRGALPWAELMRCLGRARFLLVTAELDASPRLLAEALAMDTPVLVNRRILGGWHYVTPFTGAFFDDERDIAGAARRVLEHPGSPRAWFRTHHGPLLAGARLARLLGDIDPSLRRLSRACLSFDLDEPVAAAAGGGP